MAYTTDLITVLKSLFDVVPSSSEGTMWPELNRVFQAYERFDPREQIHRRICANFQHDQQINDADGFRLELRAMLEHELGSEPKESGGRKVQATSALPTPSLGLHPTSSRMSTRSPRVAARPPVDHAPPAVDRETSPIDCGPSPASPVSRASSSVPPGPLHLLARLRRWLARLLVICSAPLCRHC